MISDERIKDSSDWYSSDNLEDVQLLLEERKQLVNIVKLSEYMLDNFDIYNVYNRALKEWRGD